mmetsp:Transcript_25225/g.82814  ORF Transcript_25225/g.82814 Transcript_25225/m.82814 type:complete len:313 (+) Transcript_25225:910-1848(+)
MGACALHARTRFGQRSPTSRVSACSDCARLVPAPPERSIRASAVTFGAPPAPALGGLRRVHSNLAACARAALLLGALAAPLFSAWRAPDGPHEQPARPKAGAPIAQVSGDARGRRTRGALRAPRAVGVPPSLPRARARPAAAASAVRQGEPRRALQEAGAGARGHGAAHERVGGAQARWRILRAQGTRGGEGVSRGGAGARDSSHRAPRGDAARALPPAPPRGNRAERQHPRRRARREQAGAKEESGRRRGHGRGGRRGGRGRARAALQQSKEKGEKGKGGERKRRGEGDVRRRGRGRSTRGARPLRRRRRR